MEREPSDQAHEDAPAQSGHLRSSQAAKAPFAAPADASAPDGPSLEPRAFLGPALMLGLIVLVFWDFLHRQVRFAINEQADWGHTLVIPFIAGYLVFRNRDRLAASGFRTTWIALVPLILGMGVYYLSTLGPQAINHHNLKGAGFGLALFGLVLLFTGFAAMRWLWFALAYLIVFGQTISNQVMHLVTYKMQDIAAVGSEKLLVLLGMDVTRAGNVLTLFHQGQEHALNIAEACSGMRMLMAFLALGVAMAVTGLSRNWQRVLLVALAAPIAIFVNMLRVVTLGYLSIYDAEFAAGDFHTFIGLVWLVPAFLMFLGAMWVVKQIVVEEDRSTSPQVHKSTSPQADRSTDASTQTAARWQPAAPYAGTTLGFDASARRAFVVACAAMLASGVGFRVAVAQLNIYLTKAPVELSEKFPTIPRTLETWQAIGPDRQFDMTVVETLGTDEYLDRTFVRRDASVNRPGVPPDDASSETPNLPIAVHLAYYTGMIDAIPHIPDRCFLAGGFARVGRPQVIDAIIDTSAWSLDPDGLAHRASGRPYHTMRFNHRITGRPVNVRMPIGIEKAGEGRGALRIRTTEFRVPERPNARVFAGFFFIANGQVTPFPLEVRSLAFDRTDKYAYYCKVQLTMEGGPDFTYDDFARHVGDLLNELLPEIMRCLPDWAEIEQGSGVRS